MDVDLYTAILEEDLMGSIDWFGKNPTDIIFQQDNDPKHTCKKAQEWFKTHGIQVLSWPAQSPDLNPIEHLWNHLKRKLGDYPTPPTGILELWERVQEEWEKIPDSVCKDLVESMPRRVAAVIKAKGDYTEYQFVIVFVLKIERLKTVQMQSFERQSCILAQNDDNYMK